MTIKYDVSGNRRKNLVKEISKCLRTKFKYLGAPSFEYEIGFCRLDLTGNLTINAKADNAAIESLLEHLQSEGYKRVSETSKETESSDLEATSSNDTDKVVTSAQTESVELKVTVPKESMSETALQNLRKLVEAKGNLIKKALGVDSLPIEVDEEKISFPWFSDVQKAETVSAYTHFITALCDMAKKQNRVTAKEKSADNEKYTFRCFLLRLGFIGSEYKKERKILLRNLSGSSAFKNITNKEEPSDEISN